MYPVKPRRSGKAGPEDKIVQALMEFLTVRGWYVMKMHGSMFQAGFPDLYATHKQYRVRLIEVKDPERQGDVFTPAQHEIFPKLSAYGSPIYVLTAATEAEYQKLFGPENWYTFLPIWRRTNPA